MHTIRKILKILIYVSIFALFLFFAMYNNQQVVSIHMLVWQTPQLPVWILVFISLILGLILGLALVTGVVLSANKEKKRLHKEMKSIKSELNRLRNVSIEEEVDSEKKIIEDDTIDNEA